MVINIGWLKAGLYKQVGDEIAAVKHACGQKLLKVIVETGLLTEDEVRKVTHIVDETGADYIKTSTGFGPRGASMRDIELFKEESQRLKIKAAGGVRDHEAAVKFIQMGVSRIGTSTGVNLIGKESKEEGKAGSY